MGRNGAGLKFEGKPCRTCGSTLRYVSNTQCVRCCNSRDRRAYMQNYLKGDHSSPTPTASGRTHAYKTQIRRAHYRTKGESELGDSVLAALSRDAADAVQRQSQMYLGLPKRMEAEAAAKPMTAGDVWRAMLPVGVPQKVAIVEPYEKTKSERMKDYKALAAAVAALLPKMPDVILVNDILPLLDPTLVETMGARMNVNLARALVAAGARRQKMTGVGAKSCYFVRRGISYSHMSARAIMEHYADMTHTKVGDPAPTGEARSAGRRKKGTPKATATELARRKRDRSRAARVARAAAKAVNAAPADMVNESLAPDAGVMAAERDAHHGASLADCEG